MTIGDQLTVVWKGNGCAHFFPASLICLPRLRCWIFVGFFFGFLSFFFLFSMVSFSSLSLSLSRSRSLSLSFDFSLSVFVSQAAAVAQFYLVLPSFIKFTRLK